MKKKHIFATLAFMVLGIGLTSCSEDLGVNYEQKDELYREMISFKAPVGTNGIYDIYMRYRDDGTASYKLPVLATILLWMVSMARTVPTTMCSIR